MANTNIYKSIVLVAIVSLTFFSCEKDKTKLAPIETYVLTGKLDASRTTIPTVALITAVFAIEYNSPNSFGEAQSVLNGSFNIVGYTGIVVANTNTTRTPIPLTNPPDTTIARTYTADTLSFFATQVSGPAISYLTVPTSIVSSYKVTALPYPTSSVVFTNYNSLNYLYNNTSNASFTFKNFPFTNDITSALREGRGYFRLGKFPKYVYILLDEVVKL
jgi:hypothetical protein